jgi:hypothetical protein
MSQEIAIPQEIERDMFRAAVDALGRGCVREYYDQMIVSDLRWAYRLGYEAGQNAPKKRTEATK